MWMMAKYEKEKDLVEDLLSVDEMNPEDGLDDTDYVFIVDANGKMKSVIFPPEETMEYHKDLLKLFALFGVNNPDELLDGHTIH